MNAVAARVGGLVVIAGAATMTLAGCENELFVSPAALRVSSDDVELAVCGEFTASSLTVFLSEPGPFGTSSELLDDSARRDIDDTVIVLSDFPGWDGDAWLNSESASGTAVEVVLQGAGSDSTFSSTIEAPEGGFPEDQWLRSDGTTGDRPC